MSSAVDVKHDVSKQEKHKPKKNLLSDGQGTLALILIAPTLFVIFLVVGIPVAMSVTESFFITSGGVNPETGVVETATTFAGLQQYADAFTESAGTVLGVWGSLPRFLNALINTLFFIVVCIAFETVLGVLMALIMTKAFKGKGLVRAAILIPWAIPTIVSALMWQLVFNTSGVANRIIGQQILWLGDSVWSQWAVVIADVWKTAPFIGLLTLAGLQTIPAEVYEAGKVDGATAWQMFWRITLPLVRPALVVAVLFRTLDTARMFDLPFGMIGPQKYSVETLSMLAFDDAQAQRYGSAAAYSVLLFLLIVVIAFLFIRFLGADLVSDPEVRAMNEARKKQKVARKQLKSSVTSGESAT